MLERAKQALHIGGASFEPISLAPQERTLHDLSGFAGAAVRPPPPPASAFDPPSLPRRRPALSRPPPSAPLNARAAPRRRWQLTH